MKSINADAKNKSSMPCFFNDNHLSFIKDTIIKHTKDRNICRHLCSKTLVLESTRNKAFSRCDQICFQLTRTHDFAGDVCPFEKYCATGCPCPFYKCEKVVNEQTLIPVWDLKNGKEIKGKLRKP